MSFYENTEHRFSNLVLARNDRDAVMIQQTAERAGVGAFAVNTAGYPHDWVRAYVGCRQIQDPLNVALTTWEDHEVEAADIIKHGGAIIHLMAEGDPVDVKLSEYSDNLMISRRALDDCRELSV